ncbi:radical SAM protein [Actinomyces gerencseriae]|uniref:radical SAM protein n=1 Tax=Actinomyces gerencseriae TaxID=52769 RepID=UPI003C6C4EF5
MPLHLVWALTNACNVRCIHCCAASARRSSNELSHDEILSQIDVLARDGLLDLALSGGEPLLIKRLENIVERAANSGITVGMGTNGGGVNQETSKEPCKCRHIKNTSIIRRTFGNS